MQKMNLLGKGNTAEVFEYTNGKVCKLFFEGYPHEYIGLEFKNAEEMCRNKIRVPKPFQMVMIENREGIIYEKIEGKTLQNIIIETKKAVDARLDMFVHLHLDILAHHSKNVLSYKEFFIAMLKNKKMSDQMIFNKVIGQPEPLRYRKAWSRRITHSDRLVYNFDENKNLIIIACMGHYETKPT